DIFHNEESVFSTSSMRTCLPAQDKRFTGPPAISLAIRYPTFDLNELRALHMGRIASDDDAEETNPG
ncbi:MAG TPA: hypothetical protein VFU49_03055, partial [Ktedonobacteraceae bacterium]|nr:hypothetical protein [Ktedonobacteraceae bacterium]